MSRPFVIASVGGGPAGLYFALLMKQAFPEVEITVHERNAPGETFGWGVVFSDETLSGFEAADPQSYAEIRRQFAYWGDIETYYGGTCVRSTGHGFCGLARKTLLQIFQGRCRELGVALEFQREIRSSADVAGADLVLAADGLNSVLRKEHEAHFRPTLAWGRARFCWLGSDQPLSAFTFIFRENGHGLFQVHAYPFEPGLSTFIVECDESAWRRAGLDTATEEQTIAYCERLFADDLRGHRLLANRSLWRSFPTVRNATWHHGNMVLLGDAAHTAHFSIGSGTKLAMEDAIALVAAFRRRCADGGKARAPVAADVPAVLADYEESRRLDVLKIQRAAQTSLQWFENVPRYMRQHPLQFTFNLMSRSKRITWDNLALRDPALVQRVAEWFAQDAARYTPPPAAPAALRGSGSRAPAPVPASVSPAPPAPPPPMFAPFRLRELQLENRIVVSPMCQYSARDGVPDDWHLVHLGSRAIGGAGLLFTEMTNVSADGRISPGCAGLWNEEQQRAWARIVAFVHGNSRARIGIQLAHAGRKGSCHLPWEGDKPLTGAAAWETCGPSALPFGPGWPAPRAMTRADMDRVRDDFVAAARRAEAAGFDLIELHMAHGYLLSSFLSPASNKRTDEYGGSIAGRLRFPLEVFDAVRAVWPAARPLGARISATDWQDRQGRDVGLTGDDAVAIARALAEHGCDFVDVSTAGNVPESVPEYGRMYQVPFADRIRHEVGVPAGMAVMAVGAIQDADHANTVLAAGRADLCALARAHLSHPYLTLDAAARYGVASQAWPNQYLAVKPRAPAR